MMAIDTRRSRPAEMPRADLLPAATKRAIRLRPMRRNLIAGVVAIVAITALAVGAAMYYASQATAELEAERGRSDALLAQQAEFAEPLSIDAAVREKTASRSLVMATEIDWNVLLTEIQGTLPEGVQLLAVEGVLTANGAVELDLPGQSTQPDAGAVPQASIGRFRITALSSTVPDVEAWLDRLRNITGFAGIAPPVTVTGEGFEYTVSIEVLLNESAFLGRYADSRSAEGN
jgi:Tfp pilus assembly protein PilN